MALRLAAVLVVAQFDIASSEGDVAADMEVVHANCRSLMEGLSSSSYSKTELSMVCRAKLPTEVCHAAARDLGEKPWSSSKMDAICKSWEERWTDRWRALEEREQRVRALEDWEAQVDEIMKKKTEVGVCNNLTVDECTVYKRDVYPKYPEELNDAMKEKHEQWRQGSPTSAPDITVHDSKFQVLGAPHVERWPANGLAVAGATSTVAAAVGALLLFLSLGRLLIGVRRRPSSPVAEADSEAQSDSSESS